MDTPEVWNAIQRVTSVENPPNVLLYGPPGTGKTHLATRLADGSRVRFSVTLTDETPAAELRGHYIPNENGGFTFHYGPAVLARRQGTRFVVNEIDRTGPDAWSYLLNVCDGIDSSIETLPNGETFSTAAGFHVIATMNGDPDDLPEALLDRFPVRFHVDQVNPEAIAALPEDLRNAANGTGASANYGQRVSVRRWNAYARLRDAVGAELAAFSIFGERAGAVLDSLTVANGSDEPELTDEEAARLRNAPDAVIAPYEPEPDDSEDYCSECGETHYHRQTYCGRCDNHTLTNSDGTCYDCSPESREDDEDES